MAPRFNQCSAMADSTKKRCRKTCIEGEMFCYCHLIDGEKLYPKPPNPGKNVRPRKKYVGDPDRYPLRSIEKAKEKAKEMAKNKRNSNSTKGPKGRDLRAMQERLAIGSGTKRKTLRDRVKPTEHAQQANVPKAQPKKVPSKSKPAEGASPWGMNTISPAFRRRSIPMTNAR